MTTWEIYFVLFYLFRNRLSKNLIKNSIIILFYRKFELFLQRKWLMEFPKGFSKAKYLKLLYNYEAIYG